MALTPFAPIPIMSVCSWAATFMISSAGSQFDSMILKLSRALKGSASNLIATVERQL